MRRQRKTTSKYHQRVRQVLKIQAINTFALSVIRYRFGIVSWTKKEMKAADVKTHQLLTMHGGFHPKSNVQRLYTSWKEGGQGLMSVQATILDAGQAARGMAQTTAEKDH